MRRRRPRCDAGTTLVEVVVAAVVMASVVASLGTVGTLVRMLGPDAMARTVTSLEVASLALTLARSLGSTVDVTTATSERLVAEGAEGPVIVHIDAGEVVVDVGGAGAGGTSSSHLEGALGSAALSYRDRWGRAVVVDGEGRVADEHTERIAVIVLDVVLVGEPIAGPDAAPARGHRLVVPLFLAGTSS